MEGGLGGQRPASVSRHSAASPFREIADEHRQYLSAQQGPDPLMDGLYLHGIRSIFSGALGSFL